MRVVATAAPAPQQDEQHDDGPADLGEVIEQAILEFTRTGRISERSRVAFEGHSFQLDVVRFEDEDGGTLPGLRNIRTAPLEGLYHRQGRPIEQYQYLAGCRFRMDWALSQISPLRAIDFAQAAIYATEELMKASRDGYDGKGLGGTLRTFAGVADAKLDAMQRLGDALGSIGNTRGWLACKVIGEEQSLTWVARHLPASDRYVAERVREMLDDLARHYMMVADQRRRGNTRGQSGKIA